jgi:thioredoxin-related protein
MKKGIYVILAPMVLLIIVSVFAFKEKAITKTETTKTSSQQAQEVNWISLEEAEKLNKTAPKKFLIDLYTNWCGWCKVMDQKVYSDAKVYEYINTNFYAVKLNAEQKESILFQGKTYAFNPALGKTGINQLAYDWGNTEGRIGYPTLVFLDENLVKLEADPGYKEVPQMLQKLKFYGDNKYKTMNWQQFQQGN